MPTRKPLVTGLVVAGVSVGVGDAVGAVVVGRFVQAQPCAGVCTWCPDRLGRVAAVHGGGGREPAAPRSLAGGRWDGADGKIGICV
jgi:hypothetical protein